MLMFQIQIPRQQAIVSLLTPFMAAKEKVVCLQGGQVGRKNRISTTMSQRARIADDCRMIAQYLHAEPMGQ